MGHLSERIITEKVDKFAPPSTINMAEDGPKFEVPLKLNIGKTVLTRKLDENGVFNEIQINTSESVRLVGRVAVEKTYYFINGHLYRLPDYVFASYRRVGPISYIRTLAKIALGKPLFN
jgi:hypothetical protein